MVDLKFVEENKGKNFDVGFDGLAKVVYSGRYKWVEKAVLSFFEVDGHIFYKTTRMKSNGYLATDLLRSIKTVKELPAPKVLTIKDKCNVILKKLHPNAWLDIKVKLKEMIQSEEEPTGYIEGFIEDCRFKSLSSVFGRWEKEEVLRRVKESFENKTAYCWNRTAMRHSGRDLTINCVVDPNGEFRAFFSSKYPGCGNGDYWLIVNPTTIMYYEKD